MKHLKVLGDALRAIHGGRAARDLEGPTLEFKEDARSEAESLSVVAQAALCFANGDGGMVVLGVADKTPGPGAFIGSSLDVDLVRRRIFELSRPPLVVDVWAERHFGARLVFVHVPRSPEIHADPQGRAPRRIGRECVPMDPGQQMRLREERIGIDWSAEPSGRSTASVSADALAAARTRLANFADERRKLSRCGDLDLLRALGVVRADGELLNAGDVLFCSPREGQQPAVVYQYRGTPGGEPRAVERLEAPLLVAFLRSLELVRARTNSTPVTLADGQQIQIEDFPGLAVREALANALIHRDYHLMGSVTVEHSPEILTVTSPGPLVSGVTPDNILTHTSKPRNPALAKAVRLLGLAEEVGRGVDRMFREMIAAGREIPAIESAPDHVRVVFVGGAANTQIARFMAQLPEQERDDTDTMLVLYRLCRARTVTAVELAPIVQKSVDEAETALRRLSGEEAAILEPTRVTARRAHPAYRLRGEVLKVLGTAVPYQRRTMDEIDRKVVAHVREYGKVTNKTIQNLFDVGIQRARDILADMVARQIIVKISAHERGPGVEYGPGVKFPARKHARKRSR
jgi:ATP-dependent DNA helicase RecG